MELQQEINAGSLQTFTLLFYFLGYLPDPVIPVIELSKTITVELDWL